MHAQLFVWFPPPRESRPARAAMALATLSGDEQCIVFVQLCNTLDPGYAVAFGSASSELRAVTQAERQQLKADYEAAAALGRKVRKRSCKELREAKEVALRNKSFSAADLAFLGTLGSVLPALETLRLIENTADPDGVQQLAAGLGAGALPVVTELCISGIHMGDGELGHGRQRARAQPRRQQLHAVGAVC